MCLPGFENKWAREASPVDFRLQNCLHQQIADDLPMHVREAEIAAGMAEGQALVVEAEQV